MDWLTSPIMIPILGTVFGTAMIVAIVGIVFWYKGRERELQVHQEMQMRQMDHDRRMKELELERAKVELEKSKVEQTRSVVSTG
jgi:hypothetical protein